jgi:hypothetical protein
VMEVLRGRFSDEEIRQLHDWITGLLREHLSHEEYHRFFLAEEG